MFGHDQPSPCTPDKKGPCSWQEDPKRCCAPLRASQQETGVSDHPITDGGNRNRLHEVVTVRLHGQVAISFSVINEYFVEKYYETMPISCFASNLRPPIHSSCLPQPSLWYSPNGGFSIFYPPSAFVGWHSPMSNSFSSPFPSINLSVWVHWILYHLMTYKYITIIIYFDPLIFPDFTGETPLYLPF